MTISSLSSGSIFTPNHYSGRAYPVTRVTIHEMAAVWTAQRCGEFFRDSTRNASSNYGIGHDGTIMCYVDEDNAAWTSADWDNDNRAITIECSNSYMGGDWPISDATYNSLIKLCADICTRYGIYPEYNGTKWASFTEHKMFANTACVPVESEVLTENGWVRLKDISLGDKIACASIDNLNISFEDVEDIVPIREQDTYTNHGFTATKDHRIVYSSQYNKNHVIDFYANVLKKNETAQVYIPLAGNSQESGLSLTDDMIRFYVAVQADGHYMKEKGCDKHYGLEFHLSKERKLERIKEILDAVSLNYTISQQSNGTTKVRVYNQDGVNIVQDICEKHLNDKCFTWDWLKLSQEQSGVFLDELLLWDGCVAGKKYSSAKRINLDVVNAVAATHGVGSRVVGSDVVFRDTPYNTLSAETKRNIKGRKETTVSCVTVKTGIFLIRQHGKTFITGNCPGPYIHNLLANGKLIEDVKNAMAGTWKKDDKGWWYQRSDGSWPKSQWEKIKGKWYYFGDDGYMKTGWVWLGSYWYYLDETDGYMHTGWIRWKNKKGVDGWYYTDDNGAMYSNTFLKVSGKWYAFDSSGRMVDNISGLHITKNGDITLDTAKTTTLKV